MKIVALGSSFAAGPGIPPIIDRRAIRSGRNYAHLISEFLDAELVDVSSAGSTTANILTVGQTRRQPPQVEFVDARTDLVTVTTAGNDLSYVGTILGTSVLRRLGARSLTTPIARVIESRRPLTVPTSDHVTTATEALTKIAEEAKRRAPKARIVFVDYLPIFGDDSAVERFTPADIAVFRATASSLSSAYADAAARSNSGLIRASALAGHELGSSDPWVNDGSRLSSAFHPNADGMRAVADRILELLAR